MKIINLKITAASPNRGPFKSTDDRGNILGDNVSLSSLVQGIAYSVENEVSVVTLESYGDCNFKKQFTVDDQVSNEEYTDATFRPLRTGYFIQLLLWRYCSLYY